MAKKKDPPPKLFTFRVRVREEFLAIKAMGYLLSDTDLRFHIGARVVAIFHTWDYFQLIEDVAKEKR